MRQCIVLIFHIWAGQASCLFIYAHVQDGCCGLACYTLSTQGTLYNYLLPKHLRSESLLYSLCSGHFVTYATWARRGSSLPDNVAACRCEIPDVVFLGQVRFRGQTDSCLIPYHKTTKDRYITAACSTHTYLRVHLGFSDGVQWRP